MFSKIPQFSPPAKTWIAASTVTCINVLVATGFAIGGLIYPHSIVPMVEPLTQGSLIFSLYAAARTVPLAVMVLLATYKRWPMVLMVLGTLAAIIQLLDAGVGLYQHDIQKTLGPLVLSLLQFYVVFLMWKSVNAAAGSYQHRVDSAANRNVTDTGQHP